MPFYHASRTTYQIGHEIRVPECQNSRAYELSLQLGNKWREDALEADRKARSSSRQTAVYAANTPGNAALFLAAQHDPENRPVRVYEVEVSSHSPNPMVLIGYMDDQGPDFVHLAKCIEEYWSPTEDWGFLEYVCEQMIVVADLGVLRDVDSFAAVADYDHDRQLSRVLWGVLPSKASLAGRA
jgi:hypothetical protein